MKNARVPREELRPDVKAAVDRAKEKAKASAAEIKQKRGWKCDACRDTKVVLDVIATTPNGDELGEVPCPDCDPEDRSR